MPQEIPLKTYCIPWEEDYVGLREEKQDVEEW